MLKKDGKSERAPAPGSQHGPDVTPISWLGLIEELLPIYGNFDGGKGDSSISRSVTGARTRSKHAMEAPGHCEMLGSAQIKRHCKVSRLCQRSVLRSMKSLDIYKIFEAECLLHVAHLNFFNTCSFSGVSVRDHPLNHAPICTNSEAWLRHGLELVMASADRQMFFCHILPPFCGMGWWMNFGNASHVSEEPVKCKPSFFSGATWLANFSDLDRLSSTSLGYVPMA